MTRLIDFGGLRLIVLMRKESRRAILNPIWTGGAGGQNGPLMVFAKYLKNGLDNLHETL